MDASKSTRVLREAAEASFRASTQLLIAISSDDKSRTRVYDIIGECFFDAGVTPEPGGSADKRLAATIPSSPSPEKKQKTQKASLVHESIQIETSSDEAAPRTPTPAGKGKGRRPGSGRLSPIPILSLGTKKTTAPPPSKAEGKSVTTPLSAATTTPAAPRSLKQHLQDRAAARKAETPTKKAAKKKTPVTREKKKQTSPDMQESLSARIHRTGANWSTAGPKLG